MTNHTPAPPDALAQPERAGDPFFESLATLFDQFTATWDQADPRFTDWLTAELPRAGQNALDLGCGAGRHAILLADRYERVLAVDAAEGMLRIARTTRSAPEIDYQRRGVLEVTPDADGTFDLVLSVHTLHHVGDPAVVLRHVRSLVAPGGTAILADIIDPGGWTDPSFHLDRAFTTARQLYQLGGDAEDAADTLRLLLHPDWLAMTAADTPLTRQQYHRHYRRALPGVTFADDLGPIMCGAVWHAPGHRLNTTTQAHRPSEHHHTGI